MSVGPKNLARDIFEGAGGIGVAIIEGNQEYRT